MDRPLGKTVGNALEVKEAIEVLSGKGAPDIMEVCITLAAKMLEAGGKGDFESCKKMAVETIANKSALKKFSQMIKAQNGIDDIIKDTSLLAKAIHTKKYEAKADGYLSAILSDRLGIASMLLGAGRATKESIINPAAGIVLLKKTGDVVKKGEPIMVLHADESTLFENAIKELDSAVVISDDKPDSLPLIIEIIG